MKKTININLAGYPFTIDDDAYQMLKDYLDTIRYAFETNEDTEDLATDIESRIAELLIENENGGVRIITLNEISKVIERIGKPSEFIEVDETIQSRDARDNMEETEIKEEKITPPPYNPRNQYSRNPFARKKLFRDPQNSMLGGVCSGFAFYLNIDVTIVRILTVLLFFLSATTVAIAYIILWIVIPEARTPLQRMQMMGEDPTVENIGKTITENFQGDNDPSVSTTSKNKFQNFLSSVISIFIKCLIILGLVVAIPLLVAAGAAILGCIIAVFVISVGLVSGNMFDTVNEGLLVLYILFAVVGGAITIGVPLWLFIRKFMKSKHPSPNPVNQRALLIVWLCGIALVSVFTVKAVKKHHQIDSNWGINFERMQELNNLESDEIENININNGEVSIVTSEGKKFKISKGKISMEAEITEETTQVQDSIVKSGQIDELETIESVKTDSI